MCKMNNSIKLRYFFTISSRNITKTVKVLATHCCESILSAYSLCGK